MIIILGQSDDLRVAALQMELERQAYPYGLLSTLDYPYRVQLSQTIDSPPSGRLHLPEHPRPVPLDEIQSVYYAVQYSFKTLDSDPEPVRQIVFHNIDSAFWSFFHALPCRFVNPIAAADFHGRKAAVLKQLRAAGIRVPDTLVTNCPEDVRAFYTAMSNTGCAVIYKPPWGQSFTDVLRPEHLTDDALGRLSHSPIMLQELIPGREIRLYVIGDDVFGVAIESDALDINQDDEAKRVPMPVSEALRDLGLKVAQTTGLLFTAIDVRLTPEGEAVVLEANSSPDFTADQHGQPLLESLVKLLQAS